MGDTLYVNHLTGFWEKSNFYLNVYSKKKFSLKRDLIFLFLRNLLFSLKKIAIHHRIGMLEIGEIPVIIAVSAAHRGAAFDACEFAIDTLKETVPIWKKEIFEDGEVWVSATP